MKMKTLTILAGLPFLFFCSSSLASLALMNNKFKQVKGLSAQLRQEAPLCTDTPHRLYDRLLTPIDVNLLELEKALTDENRYFSKASCYPSQWVQNLTQRYSAVAQEFRKFLPALNNNEGNILWGLDGSKPAKYPKCTMNVKGNISSTPPTYTYIRLKQNLFGFGLAKDRGLGGWTTMVSPDNLLSVIGGHVQYLSERVCNRTMGAK